MLGADCDLRDYLQTCCRAYREVDHHQVQRLADQVYDAYQNQRTIFFCGNGGSAANASHVCEDWGKGTLHSQELLDEKFKRLKVVSLTDNTPYILAWANDEGFERIFVEQLKNLAAPNDILLAFSGSGNSHNVVNAVKWAQRNDLQTWALTGKSGGLLYEIAGECLRVPICDMGLIESIHLVLCHWVLDDVYARIHRVGRYLPDRVPVPI